MCGEVGGSRAGSAVVIPLVTEEPRVSVYKCYYPGSQIEALCNIGDGGVGVRVGLGWERPCQLSNGLIVPISKYPA